MRIAFLAYLEGFGGAEKQMVMLANEMANRGHDVFMISISVDNNCYSLNESVKYIYIPDSHGRALRHITRFHDIKKVLKKIAPDITINFWYQSAYLAAGMSKKITGKVVYSERGDPGDKEYDGLLGKIRAITLPRIDGFVFQSKGAQNYFDKSVQNRSVVIANPIFVKKSDYPELKERRKAIVTVGRLHPQKNHKLLIDSFALIADQIPEYTLEIWGDGELKNELKKQAESYGLSDRVLLKGTSNKIHDLIYDASLFVLSSDYEGLPNTLLEAMTLGIPSISTDCRPGGAREIISDGEDGLITPVGDREKLAEAMKELIINHDRAMTMASKAAIAMERYRSEIIYSEWEEFFVKLKSGEIDA